MELAKKFETQTGIHIDFQIIPDATYFQVLSTKLNTGNGPDIFGGQSGVSDLKVNYHVETNAVDLSNEDWVSREDPNALAQATVDGKVYGQEIWDIYSGYWVIVYNKTIFQQAGITSVPATYADFVADCAKIKAAGINPIYEPISDGWHQVLWYPEIGARMENLEPGLYAALNANQQTLAADPASNTAMSQINELYQKGYFGSTALSDQFANTEKNMAGGKYAMTINTLTEPQAVNKPPSRTSRRRVSATSLCRSSTTSCCRHTPLGRPTSSTRRGRTSHRRSNSSNSSRNQRTCSTWSTMK